MIAKLWAEHEQKGNCYDNAYMESFFSTLKRELVHSERYRTREEARLGIFEYMEVFYNRIRRHSALGYKSPEQHEKNLKETSLGVHFFGGRQRWNMVMNCVYNDCNVNTVHYKLCPSWAQFRAQWMVLTGRERIVTMGKSLIKLVPLPGIEPGWRLPIEGF